MKFQENGEEGKPLECPKISCGKEWTYNGKAYYRTSCPSCGTSVRIKPKCPKCGLVMVGKQVKEQWECIKGCGHIIKENG